MFVQIGALPGQLPGRLVGDPFVGPDLSVRVRVAGAHHRAAVLEDLDVADPRLPAELQVLLGPGVDDPADLRAGHRTHGHVVAGREADDPAQATLGFGDQEGVGGRRRVDRVGQQRGEVVVEDVGGGVPGRADTAGARVARAQVAVGVVGGSIGDRGRLLLPLPRPGGAVRGNQHPLAGELVETPVRGGVQVLRHPALSCPLGPLVVADDATDLDRRPLVGPHRHDDRHDHVDRCGPGPEPGVRPRERAAAGPGPLRVPLRRRPRGRGAQRARRVPEPGRRVRARAGA